MNTSARMRQAAVSGSQLTRRRFLTTAAATTTLLALEQFPTPAASAAEATATIQSSPGLKPTRDVLPRMVAVIEQGMRDGLHIGAQVYVSVRGEPRADFGIGESRPGVPMTADSMLVWYSMSKAPTAVCIAQLWERGKLDLDDRVAKYIPEFAANGKDVVTIRHVLTHTAGFPRADAGIALTQPFDVVVKTICDAPLEPDWVPGHKAEYHPTSGWYILGELVRRIDGRPFNRYVREELFEPLGLTDSWIGMAADKFKAYGDRIGWMMNTMTGTAVPATLPENMEIWCGMCVPGANGHGPMRELGRFYEALLFRGKRNSARILSPQTVEAITAHHRTGMLDAAFKIEAPWGLGISVDPRLCGKYRSPRTFGHGGSLSSQAFCDPECGLVAAIVCNGRPTNAKHIERFTALAEALYVDLGIVAPDSPPTRAILEPKP
jgi:CubicO group peptidase (beta-lactamase class C family)